MKKSPKLTPWLLALLVCFVQVAWCWLHVPSQSQPVPLIVVPTPLNDNDTPQTTDWNGDIGGVCNFINASIVMPLNVVSTKGDLYGYNGAMLEPVNNRTDGYILQANSTNVLGVNWASYTGATAVATTGDLETCTATGALATLPVGTDAEVLTANSNAVDGVDWEPAPTLPSGAIVPWSPAFAGSPTIPTGWLLCDGTNNTPNLIGLFVIGTRPSGSSSSPSSGGYGAHGSDAQYGTLTHTHGVAPWTTGGSAYTEGYASSTSLTTAHSGTGVSTSTHRDDLWEWINAGYHTGPVQGSISGSCASAGNEPADYALVYICKQ